MRKLLIPIQGDFIAPRFDLATEVMIVRFEDDRITEKPRSIIMERPSNERLCQMVVAEHITDLICGGIEELHYKFLVWKKINVFDSVIGDWQTAIDKILAGKISQGDIFFGTNAERLSL